MQLDVCVQSMTVICNRKMTSQRVIEKLKKRYKAGTYDKENGESTIISKLQRKKLVSTTRSLVANLISVVCLMFKAALPQL